MKKLFVSFILAGTMLFSGCNVIEGVMSGDLAGSLLNTPSVDVYEELASLASNPNGNSDLSGSFTFVAEVASEPFEMELDGENYTYQEIYICRSYDDPILLDVGSVAAPAEAGTYSTITATWTGSIYWTEDNKRVEVLDLKGSKMEPFTVSDAEPDMTNNIHLEKHSYNGNIEFVGAHYSRNSFNDVVVVYFNFKNNAPDTNTKLSGVSTLLGMLDVYHGDMFASGSNSFSPDELDPGALKAGDITSYTPSGKTQLYYTIYKAEPEAGEDIMYFALFDDEFALTNVVEIPIAASLAEMK